MPESRISKATTAANIKLGRTENLKSKLAESKLNTANLKFEDGYVPQGKVIEFPKQPLVLKFQPTAYRSVEPKELKAWQADIAQRTGAKLSGDNGTVTFCGGSGESAVRSDADIETAASAKLKLEGPAGRLRSWDALPIVLDFPPSAYEVVGPAQYKEWVHQLQKQLGVKFDIVTGGGGSGGTITFCERGGSGAAGRCDCDDG
ncbi:hypothetical protein H0A66_05625 [Alcaligenaceae bacterium]|nr:hypothetical protein [Alcaligenaceae bacterium]